MVLRHIESMDPMEEISHWEEIELIDEMYEVDQEFDYREKNNQEYFIGIYIEMNSENELVTDYSNQNQIDVCTNLLLGTTVSANLFFMYPFRYIVKYLLAMTCYGPYSRLYNINVNIMQLFILKDEVYSVVIKTYWIKIIQRHWKTVIAKRKKRMEENKKIQSILYRELRGRFPPSNIPYSTLRGMLSVYTKK